MIKQITDEETNINHDLFNKYFKFQRPSVMLMLLNKTNDTEKNNKLVNLINSGLKDLKEEIKKMSEAEIENEYPELIVKIVEKILKFNKQNQQKGQGVKILTPNQMLNRLPAALAQLQAGNNSTKLKNEIRHLLYSLYHSKNMTKHWYYLKRMETIFMNTENSKTNEPHRFKLDLEDKLKLKNFNKNIALVDLSIYYTWKNIKTEYNNNKFQISGPTWNENCDLPDGSYTIDDIQDYFEFIIKKARNFN